MSATQRLIEAQQRKLERQKASVTDTEHHIRVLKRQLESEQAPTPIEAEAAKAGKK